MLPCRHMSGLQHDGYLVGASFGRSFKHAKFLQRPLWPTCDMMELMISDTLLCHFSSAKTGELNRKLADTGQLWALSLTD